MAYGTPADPVAGTVITVAYAVTNILDPIRQLRANTGAAEPTGSNRVVVASAPGGPTSWQQVGTNVISDGAVTDVKMATQKLSLTGGALSYDLYISRSNTAQPTVGYLVLGSNAAYYIGFDGTKHVIATPRLDIQGDTYVYRASAPSTGYLILGTSSAIYVGFDGSHLVASTHLDVSGTLTTPTATITGSLTAPTATITGNVQASRIISTIGTGTPPFVVNSVTAVAGLNADFVDGFHAGNAANQIPISNTVENANLNAAMLNGMSASAIIAAAASGGVPSGVIAAVRSAAAIPSGWARFTDGDGRVLIGGGTLGGVGFTEDTAVGATWLHAHTSPAHGHTVANHHHDMNHTHTVAGHTHSADHGHGATSTGPAGTGTGGGTGATFADGSHTHVITVAGTSGFSTGSTTGGTSGISGTNTGDTNPVTDGIGVTVSAVTSIPVMGRVVVHIIKT